jgi:ABC-2 type transport system ATP-binding protein
MSFRLGLRVSAAGVLMGLSLAGPQALGTANADDTDSGSGTRSASAGASDSPARNTAPHRGVRKAPAAVSSIAEGDSVAPAAAVPASRGTRAPRVAAPGLDPSEPITVPDSALTQTAPPAAAVTPAAAVPQTAAANDNNPVPTASVTAASPSDPSPSAKAQLGDSAITTNPTIAWDAGVLMGNVGATCAKCGDQPLVYTVIKAPDNGGKVNINIGPDATQTKTGQFAYLPDTKTLTTSATTEGFSIMVNSTTAFSRFVTGIPLVGSLMAPIFQLLYRTPIVGDLLAPIIGYSTIAEFDPNAKTLAAGRPTAFTTMMPSFDGTLISVNYFPAVNVATGAVTKAPTVLNGAYLGNPGNTNPNSVYAEGGNLKGLSVPGVKVLRTDSTVPAGGSYSGGGGYNVVTWDPRGEFASGGVVNWDKPLIEGRDASTIISWLTTAANPAKDQVATTGGNAVVGMVGGSYGGAVQLGVAGTDPRVKAIVPGITWNSLLDSFYPSGSYLTSYGLGLFASLIGIGAKLNSQIVSSTLTGSLFGYLSSSDQAFYATSGPTVLVDTITAPTLLIQGTVDILFPLQQAVTSATTLAGNGVPAKMIWFCGGHGECIDPENPAQGPNNITDAMKWLDTYVAETTTAAKDIPTFQWYDQRGRLFSSALLPSAPNFNSGSVKASGDGGLLPVVPLIGGSGGPQQGISLISSLAVGSKAANAVNLTFAVPDGVQVAGAPTVSITYNGLGTGRFLYGQLVDDETGRVLGNLTTPIPVTLDGKDHTVTMPLADIAYTAKGAKASLTLQIISSSTQYQSFTSFGLANVSKLSVELPTINPANVNP